jgi:hypothetical protein
MRGLTIVDSLIIHTGYERIDDSLIIQTDYEWIDDSVVITPVCIMGGLTILL